MQSVLTFWDEFSFPATSSYIDLKVHFLQQTPIVNTDVSLVMKYLYYYN